MSIVIEVLIDARALVREGWTQGTFARNPDGKAVPVFDDEAVSFCGVGAICRAAGGMNDFFYLAYKVYRECLGTSPPEWNDEVTHDEVLAHFDETIATMRSREGAYA